MTKVATSEVRAAPSEAWDAIAEAYDAHVLPHESGVGRDTLRLAGLEPGHRFLDVAAGPGGLALAAARLGAEVVAIDWAPRMIERLEARAREAGLSDVEGRVMDCHALEFDDDTFDVTGSRFGVMLVPEQPRALREMVRVTRRGGRVLVIAFNAPDRFEALQFFLGAIKAVVPEFEGLPADAPPLEFQVSDPAVLHRRLDDAGLRHVTVDIDHHERVDVRSGQELWDWCLGSNPIPGMLIADLGDEQKASVRGKLDEMVAARSDERGVATLTAALNIGIGTK